MGKVSEKKKKAGPEKFWQACVNTYFQFYRTHFRDNDGFQLSPDWSPEKRGMESVGLKGIITRLRTIAEEKKIEWTEETAIYELKNFLQKAYNIPFHNKSFMCCLMNKYKDQIIVSQNNPSLVKKILNVWYIQFPDYTRDEEKDRTASEIIIGFLKQQYLTANISLSDESFLQSVNVIFKHVKQDEFWSKKSLRSISNNLQEFVNKIKSNNGNTIGKTVQGFHGSKPVPRINPEGGFGKL